MARKKAFKACQTIIWGNETKLGSVNDGTDLYCKRSLAGSKRRRKALTLFPTTLLFTLSWYVYMFGRTEISIRRKYRPPDDHWKSTKKRIITRKYYQNTWNVLEKNRLNPQIKPQIWIDMICIFLHITEDDCKRAQDIGASHIKSIQLLIETHNSSKKNVTLVINIVLEISRAELFQISFPNFEYIAH